MTLAHKAFIFDSDNFCKELKPILESCLLSGDVSQIRAFILKEKSALTDPYEGEDLDDDWEDMIEDKDVHQYGDFALTKYYSPALDIGLGNDWEEIRILLSNAKGLSVSLVLGDPLRVDNKYFDPGKMGSYFQDYSQVLDNLESLKKLDDFISNDIKILVNDLKYLLEKAASERKGIYTTF